MHHFITYYDRIRIEALYRAKHKPAEIAAHIGVHRATIYRELKRGYYMRQASDLTYYLLYSADIAQRDYDTKQAGKGPALKIAKDHYFAGFVRDMIKIEHYSPAAVLGFIKHNGLVFDTSISQTTLYKYIRNELFYDLSLNDLPRKGSYKKENAEERHYRIKKPLAKTIHERPPEVEERKLPGHW